MRSGFVSLVGRPNVGKSTLINALVGYKIAITSNKAQTTRNLVQGIYNDDDSQIVFVDTPGIHKPKHKLGQRLNEEAYYSIDDVDIIYLDFHHIYRLQVFYMAQHNTRSMVLVLKNVKVC